MLDTARRVPGRRRRLATGVLVNDIDRVSLTAAGDTYNVAGGGVAGRGATKQGSMFFDLLTNRKVRGQTVGLSGYGYAVCLFLTWLPSYLARTMHINLLSASRYQTVPRIFATLSDLPVGGET